ACFQHRGSILIVGLCWLSAWTWGRKKSALFLSARAVVGSGLHEPVSRWRKRCAYNLWRCDVEEPMAMALLGMLPAVSLPPAGYVRRSSPLQATNFSL